MINVNIEKAKEIAHTKRREARAREFAPLDELIAKQIPGHDLVAVEAQRQAIRDKYDVIEGKITRARSIKSLTEIVGGL